MEKEDVLLRIKQFTDDHGELLTLKANMKAINLMLIKRGKSDELYESLIQVMNDFDKLNKDEEIDNEQK